VLRKGSYSHRNRNRPETLIVVHQIEALNLGSKGVNPYYRILQRSVRQNNSELFAAVSAADIAGAEKCSQ
jgi:hypothetical protein